MKFSPRTCLKYTQKFLYYIKNWCDTTTHEIHLRLHSQGILTLSNQSYFCNVNVPVFTRLKMMAIISRIDFIQGQFAFETKKILVHIKLTKYQLRKLFLFLRHQESEAFKFTKKGAKTFVYKRLLTRAEKGKAYHYI